MRAALARRAPALIREYGIFPWMLEQFTVEELRAVLAEQDARWKILEKQAAEYERMKRARR